MNAQLKKPRSGDPGSGFFTLRQNPGAFRRTLHEVFRNLDSLHHGMISVPDLVSPSAKSTARINPLLDEPRMNGGQSPVAPDGGNRVGIGHTQQLTADDLGCRLLGVRSLLLTMPLIVRSTTSSAFSCLKGEADTSASSEKYSPGGVTLGE